MPNLVELLVHYLACFKAGVVVTPLNYRYTTYEIDHALEVSEASALVVHTERIPELTASRATAALPIGTIAFSDEPGKSGQAHCLFAELLSCAENGIEAPRIDPWDPAAIFFTSGSTGPAKGVTHTVETLRWMLASVVDGFEFSRSDVCVPGSSMSHIGSFMWSLAALAVGARVVIVRTYDAHEILPLLRRHQPTVLAMLPAALAALVRDHDVKPVENYVDTDRIHRRHRRIHRRCEVRSAPRWAQRVAVHL
jgi:acyl-CoA synthetase (AMP-forming)/AMP-acid ligase II